MQGLAEELDRPRSRAGESDDVPQQGRLAAARTADQGDDLALRDVEIQPLVYDVAAETRVDAAQRHDGRRHGRHHHTGKPTERVAIANTASTRITTVIADTTEAVVLDDRLSVSGCTRSPK